MKARSQLGLVTHLTLQEWEAVAHRETWASEGEQIDVLHRAMSRQTYAAGALRAARWLVAQPPGLYGMDAVL